MPDPLGIPADLAEVVVHAFGPDRAKSMLSILLAHRRTHYPIANHAQNQLHRAFSALHWNDVDRKLLQKAISAIPNIQIGIDGHADMDACWPWWLGVQLQESFKRHRVLVEPEHPEPGSCDLFMLSPEDLESEAPSRLRGGKGSGVAIECKAISGSSGIDQHLSKGRSQLEKYGGGVIAVDFSRLLHDSCVQHTGDTYQQMYERCMQMLNDYRSQVRRYMTTRERKINFQRTVHGVVLHACVLSARRDSRLLDGGYIVYRFERALAIATCNSETNLNPSVRRVLDGAVSVRPCFRYCAPVDAAFEMRDNARLSLRLDHVNQDFSLKIAAMSDAPLGPEVPITGLDSVAAGTPDQHNQGVVTIHVERYDKAEENMRLWFEKTSM